MLVMLHHARGALLVADCCQPSSLAALFVSKQLVAWLAKAP